MANFFDGKNVLVTGGTGSFGKKLCKTLVERYRPRKVIVFSRDELKQFEMRQELPDDTMVPGSPMRYLIGDVRDGARLLHAFRDVNVVVHAAALKQITTCEYNPIEAVKTNVEGAVNVVTAAIEAGVQRVIALSTDKAVNPVNLYGATKLCAEKIFVAARSWAGSRDIRFSVVRYGNVLGSRGSVIPVFLRQRAKGVVTITHPEMTRFWISLQQGVDLVINSLQHMRDAEVFVPKLPTMRVLDLARAICPDCQHQFTGIRQGEKLHEVLMNEDESRLAREYEGYYVISTNPAEYYPGSRPCPERFRYASDSQDWVLGVDDLTVHVNEFLDENPEYL